MVASKQGARFRDKQTSHYDRRGVTLSLPPDPCARTDWSSWSGSSSGDVVDKGMYTSYWTVMFFLGSLSIHLHPLGSAILGPESEPVPEMYDTCVARCVYWLWTHRSVMGALESGELIGQPPMPRFT